MFAFFFVVVVVVVVRGCGVWGIAHALLSHFGASSLTCPGVGSHFDGLVCVVGRCLLLFVIVCCFVCG